MSASGMIGGVTESAAYTYDNLGRLMTSNQMSNTVSAQRRFAYDRWGNRTGMWDAVSGGNQIQSITLQQSGGAPTNQIASVTSGSTVNYVYDAAGNVTNDGVHTYGYDSENRIVSVDGGSTASYAYDNQNRRYKKTIGSTVTHYVWQGSQVLSEHNGSNGAVLIDYVYSGSRMVAKVASGSTQYFLSDRLSVRLSLDSGGNIVGRQGHLPFGEDFGESGTQEKHHFTSYERDGETGTDYGVNRQYGATVGRFVRASPSAGCRGKPQGSNRYCYVQNDSINRSDPLGLKWILVGCSGAYSDGFRGSCQSCTQYNDETGEIRVRAVCDSAPPVDGKGEPFVTVGEPGGETGGRGGGDTGPTGPLTCGECCDTAWQIAWDFFLMEMSISGTAAQLAFGCWSFCIGGVNDWQTCFNSCLIANQVAAQRKIRRAVNDFFLVLGSQSNLCTGLNNCSCPWT
jgi:RHS repeat-associated protein